jgi:hypothetical protein
LFANAVRWLAPESFRRQELSVSSVGAHDIDLEATLDSASISVASDDRQPVPWTLDGRTLRLFAANPGVIRIGTPDRSLSLSLTLPEPGDVIWSPRKAVYGLPPARLPGRAPRELWYWLALLGGVGLFLEWLLYARGSRRPTPVLSRMPARRASAWKKAS